MALALAASAVVLGPQPAEAATIDTNAWYQIVNRESGKALDVFEAGTADGGDVIQWTVSAGANQQWQFVSSGSGNYRLKARHSGKVLDVFGRGTADGADVIQWADSNATNQQWSVTDTTNGYVKLRNRNSGKVLDVAGGTTSADGADVIQWTDNGGANQQWRLDRVGSGGSTPTPSPAPTGTTRNLTIPNTLGTHDPTRIINDNGSYYFYSTGRGLPGWYTTDGRNWQRTPQVFPNGLPASLRAAVPENDGYDVWAPDIIWNPTTRLFHLYYSVANWDSTARNAIGMVTSPTLNPNASNYRWTDRGVVIARTPSSAYTAIDPAPFFDANGNMWMTFGSGYAVTRNTALNVVPLDKNTGLRSGNPTVTPIKAGGIEAAYIHYRNGYYYFFWNNGGCCSGAASTYEIHVARSTSVTGPYTERSPTFYRSTGSIHGPGHIGILSENGTDYFSYHYYPDTGGSVLGLGTIRWGSDGWPTRN